jgi:3-oxoacyl-[acyl-carrier protein] reductase
MSKAISNDTVRDNVTINNLLPERIDTPRQDFMARRIMERDGISMDEAKATIASTIRAGRLGRPEEFGAVCAFVCSEQAGYMSGQNFHVDGGSYGGLV